MTVRWPAKRGDTAAAAAEVNDLSVAVTWANIPIANVPTGTSGTTVALGDHTHTGVYSAAAHVHEGTVIDATAVTDGYVLTADGAGNAAWEILPAAGAEVNDLSAAVTWANIPIANVPTGITSVTVALGDHVHTGVYAPLASPTFTGTVTAPRLYTTASGESTIFYSTVTGDEYNYMSWRNSAGDRYAYMGMNPSGNFELNVERAGGIFSFADAVSITGALTATSFGGITSANLLDKSATETVSGAWNFSAADVAPATLTSKLSANTLYLDGKECIAGSDTWIRLNQNNTFTSGIYTPGGMRIDGTLQHASTWSITGAGAISAVSFGGITSANLVDKSAAEVISGEWSVPAIARNKTASYTMVLGDAGQVVRFTGATASKVCTIPANASVAFPIGTMIGITNDGSATMTLAITTDTMTWGKDNTTGTRTLAAGADCVILKTTSTTWKVNGSALVT